MKRSLIAFQALLASSAVLCQTAEASSTYTSPEQIGDQTRANSIESRIDAVRNSDWSSLLNTDDMEGDQELLAKSKWGNGGGHKFKNSRGSGKWKNGKGGNSWSNSRPKWGNGGYHGGWRNGGTWRNGSGGFVNW